MENFKDKVVVITGGATGIGYSFAKKFGQEGAKIVIAGRRQNRNEEAVARLKNLGIEATAFPCDVTDRKSVEELADQSWEKYGHVDVIVNNAGNMVQSKSVIDSTGEDFQKGFAVNVYGMVNGCSVFGKRMIEQGTPAAIYNIGSENSFFHGVPFAAPYVASKHAALAISESLREETPDFIEVSHICPGFVKSELGDEASMQLAMDTDKYTSIAMEQIKEGKFYVVSHAYNMKRIDDRYKEVKEAFDKYAPRYEGDEEHDVRTLMQKLMEAEGK
ncbi:SDR family NAD(P)-dependent oxidoreductase [Marinifilum sp.]|uniref:SDR family NAD(P)-dependent oxidoreductase n=1 Tax=Marinifilum sp. TaxID=2033137 RepID=UPI003BA8E867